MKKRLSRLTLAVLLTAIVISCSNDSSEPNFQDNGLIKLSVTKEVENRIEELGFSSQNISVVAIGDIEYFIVENDILISQEQLNNGLEIKNNLLIAEEEQYSTNDVPVFGTVRTGRRGTTYVPKTINLWMDAGFPNSYHTALQAAVGRYNAIAGRRYTLVAKTGYSTLGHTFGSYNVNIVNQNLGPGIWGSAGFPFYQVGDDPDPNQGHSNQDKVTGIVPFETIILSPTVINTNNQGFLTTLLAHEFGHCLGFRHTDWFNRSYSCGTGGSEGAGTEGAVNIPGTPTSEDAGSWMLACSGNTTDRPFTANDIIAIEYLFTF